MSGSRIISKALGQTPPAVTSPRAADTAAPSAPGVPVINSIVGSTVTVTVAAATDAVGVVGYAAYLDGAAKPWADSPTTTINLFGVLPGPHSVVVRAFDSVNNYSTPSAAVNFQVEDTGESRQDSGSFFPPALVKNLIGEAVSNTVLLQGVLNKIERAGGGKLNLNVPGFYSFRGGSNPQAILEVGDNTEIEIGGGVVLDNLGSDVFPFFSKTLFINKNATSNFTPIVSITVVQDTVYNWHSRVTCNIGSAVNPFSVGDYVYIRPAYTSPDTTGYFNWVYEVMAVNNDNSASKTFSFDISGTAGPIPALNGNLIAYPANANIYIHGQGAIRQREQNRGGGSATVFSRGSFMQSVMNKALNCKVRINLIQSPGSVSCVLANSFNCTIGADGAVANGVMVFGNNYGFCVEGVAGESKDDLVVIFPSGTGYPFYDAGGVQANSVGPVIGGVIDYQGKIHKNCESHGLSIISEGGELIDAITVKNYVGRNLSGQPFGIGNGYGAFGGNCNIGSIRFENINFQPRRDKPFFVFTSIPGGSTTIKKLSFDGLQILGGSVDGNVGLGNINGRLVNMNGTTGAYTIDDFSINNATINVDCTATAATDVDLIWGADTALIKRFSITNSKVVAQGNAKAAGFLNMTANSTASGVEEFIAENVDCGLPYRGLLRCDTRGRAPTIRLRNVKIVAPDQNGIINGDLPTGSRIIAQACDFSGVTSGKGLWFSTNNAAATYDWTFSGCVGGSRLLINPSATNKTHNVRSMGGNQVANQTLGGAGNTWNFHGMCADLRVDITAAARIDGSIIYNTNAAAGTLGAAGLVVGQGTAANSYKLMANPSLAF
jgi:hypothetical protein